MTAEPERSARRRRSPSVAIALSFLWPGLGQAYTGRRRAALLYAAPVVLVLLAVAVQAAGGLTQLAALIIVPSTALTILILLLLLGAWRLLSMADAAMGAQRGPWYRGRAGVVFAILAALVIGVHGWTGYVAYAFWDAGTHIFTGDVGPDSTQAPGSPAASGIAVASPSPSDPLDATPFETPATASSRITFLLSGVDSGAGRNHALTDTLLVVSIDPDTKQVVMVSVPRDIAQFPLYDGRTFSGKINSLMTWAALYPKLYPDGPLPTLVKELSYIVGVPINYYAAVNLDGFRRLVDAVGGVTVNVERTINDPSYDWLNGKKGFFLSAGVHKLDGQTALAYVRSRYGVGDNDFTRARRQQLLLLALRDKLTTPAMLPKIPQLIQIAGDSIKTNFPPEQVGQLLQLASEIDREGVTQVVLQPPTYTYHPPTNTTGGTYILRLQMDAVAQLSVKLFGQDSRYWTADSAGASTSPVP